MSLNQDERILETIDQQEMVGVCGRNEEFLRIIRDAFNCKIVARGNQVVISGDVDEVAKLRELFLELLFLYRQGLPLTAHDVRYSIYMVKAGKTESLHRMYADTIITNNRGRQVKAKTLGQWHYVETIRHNHITLGIGPAGTGKTYLAKQIARLLLFGKSDEIELNDAEKEIYKSHVEFVQFHPSYDYSDFVEGMRPFTSDEGSATLGFERKDGVFKEFCKRAILNAEVENDNFDEAWSAMIADITSQDYIDVQLISGKGMFRVELNEYGTGLANRTYPNNVYEKDQWIVGKSKFFSKDQLKNIYHGRNGVPGGGHDNYRRAIVEHMKQNYGLKDYEQIQVAPKPYIFIIDEINRGELSKILGAVSYTHLTLPTILRV